MKLALVVPVYNDWESYFELVNNLQLNESLAAYSITHYAVNDCSTDTIPNAFKGKFDNINILHCVRNLGHQKAIAIGLCYVQSISCPDAVVVMDADGEDRPKDVSVLIEAALNNPQRIFFAQRAKRYESGYFKMFYALYKSLFRSVTGECISFGNFSIIPGDLLYKVVHISEIWNNYPGGIMRSKLPYESIMVKRGNRYSGESKMTFVSLVIHGLSAMSVYLDVISVRLLILQIFLALTLASTLIAIAFAALLGNIAIPDWLVTFSMLIGVAFLINVFMNFMLTFMVLSYRSQQTFIPKYDAHRFIEKVEQY